MKWRLMQGARSGWFTALAERHIAVDLGRLYTILDDPDSWPLAAPRRRTLIEKNQRLGFAFDNETKAEISFETIKNSLTKISIRAENLHDRDEVTWATNYWATILDSLVKRTQADPVIGYTAPGKINLYFRVGPLRADGYHEVASMYQAVDLHETVLVEFASSWQVSVRGDLSPVHIAAVPTGEDNLVVKAAQAVAKAAKIKNPVPLHFTIDKRVPVAGGMGGGSADAAAAIYAANDIYKAKLSPEKLQEIAAKIGADVPFSINGGLAVGRGIGDQLEIIKQPGQYHWVLVVDELGLSTPLVYNRVDELRSAPGSDPTKVPSPSIPSALLRALRAGAPAQEIAPLLHNDLQAAAITLRPELKRILDLVEEVEALAAMVSGSGPTVAFLCADAENAIGVASRLRTRGLRVIVTTAPAQGIEAVQ